MLWGQASRPHLGNQITQPPPEIVDFRGLRRTGDIRIADSCGPSLGYIDPTFFGKRTISFGDGVKVNSEVDRQTANGRQNISGAKSAFDCISANLIHDLAIDRHSRCKIDSNVWRRSHCCIVYVYTIQYAMSTTREVGKANAAT